MQSVERWATRSDAWTPEDDAKLAALVLHHIRIGSTQLRAFDTAANELSRTAAACGYRWNGVVRKGYRAEIESAKWDRKSAQKNTLSVNAPDTESQSLPTTMTSSDSMKEVIKFLQAYDEQYQNLRQHVEALEADKAQLLAKLQEFELESVRQAPEPPAEAITPQQLEEDSKALFAIMERARKLLESDAARTRAES